MSKILDQFEKTIDEISKLKDVQSSQLLEPIREGKWSIREIVGHMYYWDKLNLEQMVPHMTDGANLPPYPDHDEYNAEAIAFLKDHSVESIINMFIQTRQELIGSISKVSGNIRFTIGNGKRQFSKESFIKPFVNHDMHHLKQIHEKLGR